MAFIFGGDPGSGADLTYDQLKQKQGVAQALMMRGLGSAPKNLGEGLNAVGQALIYRQMLGENADSQRQLASAGAANMSDMMDGAPPAPSGTAAATAPSGAASNADLSTDPVSTDIAPQQRALLNAIAGPESNGVYNVRYTPQGGTTFNGYDKHPGIFEQGPDGPSSAAGRYQFTKTTWDGLPDEAKGDGTFAPANQDKAALYLAGQDYQRRTGRDLNADIQANGFTPQIAAALGPTWAGLKDNPGKAIAVYGNSLKRYDTQQDYAQDQELDVSPQPTVANSLPAGDTMVNGRIVQQDPRLKVEQAIAARAAAAASQPPQGPVQVASVAPTTMTDAAPAGSAPLAAALPVPQGAPQPSAPAFADPSQVNPQLGALGGRVPSMAGQPLALTPSVAAQPVAAPPPAPVASLPPAAAPVSPQPIAAPQQAAAFDPSDPPVQIKGFQGTWTRAQAAKTDPNDTSTPDAEDVAAAQKGSAPTQVAQAAPQSPVQQVAGAVAARQGMPDGPAPAPAIPAAPGVTPKQWAAANRTLQMGGDPNSPQMIVAKAIVEKQLAQQFADPVKQATDRLNYQKLNRDVTGPGYDLEIASKRGGLQAQQDAHAKSVKDLAGEDIQPMTPDQRAQYKVPDGQAAFMKNGVPTYLGGSAVTVNLGDSANKKLNDNIVDDIQASKTKAAAAVNTIKAIDRANAVLPDAITGGTASTKLAVRNTISGLFGINDPGVEKTQEYQAAISSKMAEMAKQLSGSGHTTNMDIDVSKMMSGSDINYTRQALQQILSAQRQLAMDQIAGHNKSVDKFAKVVPGAKDMSDWYRVDPPEVPQAAAPRIRKFNPATGAIE